MLFHSLLGSEIRIATFNGALESPLLVLDLNVVMECSVTLEQLVTGVTLVSNLFVNGIDMTKKT